MRCLYTVNCTVCIVVCAELEPKIRMICLTNNALIGVAVSYEHFLKLLCYRSVIVNKRVRSCVTVNEPVVESVDTVNHKCIVFVAIYTLGKSLFRVELGVA